MLDMYYKQVGPVPNFLVDGLNLSLIARPDNLTGCTWKLWPDLAHEHPYRQITILVKETPENNR